MIDPRDFVLVPGRAVVIVGANGETFDGVLLDVSGVGVTVSLPDGLTYRNGQCRKVRYYPWSQISFIQYDFGPVKPEEPQP